MWLGLVYINQQILNVQCHGKHFEEHVKYEAQSLPFRNLLFEERATQTLDTVRESGFCYCPISDADNSFWGKDRSVLSEVIRDGFVKDWDFA